jgi:hypothetical protein
VQPSVPKDSRRVTANVWACRYKWDDMESD